MVAIKDMEMPSCCNSCDCWSFNCDDEPLCDLTYKKIRQFDKKRQKDCPLVQAIPLDKIKQAREEMDIASYSKGYDEVLEILDKLIESEDT